MKKLNKVKSRIISLAISMIMILSIVPTAAFAEENSWTSRKPSGKPIYTQEDLANMNVSDSAEYYLANDIELTGQWTPLKSFRGVLDGNGHKITGLYITEGLNDGYDAYKFGLFEDISGSGEVKNLGIEGTIHVTDEKLGEGAVGFSAGLLAGIISNDYNNPEGVARINNVWVKGDIIVESTLNQKSVGGLTGIYNGGIGNNVYSAVKGAPMVATVQDFVNISNFYYDNNLYTGESNSKGIVGKTTEFMQSQEFVDLLNANKGEGIEWIKNQGGYPQQQFKESPIVENINIYTVEDLEAISNNLSANYTLMNDIDLEGKQWTMIGSEDNPFEGVLNGNGYAIKNLKYSGGETAIGLISCSTGVIKNLGIEGAIVEATGYMTDNVGSIVGMNKGIIENSYAKDVNISPKYALRSGLLVGSNIDGQIKNSYASGVGSKGTLAVGSGIYENSYYDSDVLKGNSSSHINGIGKTTAEMQEQAFVDVLNTNTLEGIKWVKVEGNYPEQANDNSSTEPEVPEVDEELVQEMINKMNEVRENIVGELKDSKDPWVIMSVVANGNKNDLTNINEFKKESYEVVSTSKSIYDIEKTIIGLSAIGVDATNLSNGNETINALEVLANQDLESLVNATIFGLVAYDSGAYDMPVNSKYTREEIITMILDKQSEKGGWSLVGRGEDVDMTAMAIHSLSPYYTSKNAEVAGISEEAYNRIKNSVDKGVNLLSELQLEDGSFGTDKYASGSNANSTAMVINALSALGVDSLRDARFIKNDKSVVDGLFKFVTEDNKGFGFKDNKYNAMATEQSFRGLVSYSKFNENKEAYNIYQCNVDSIGKEPNPEPSPNPEEKPEQNPEEKPEQNLEDGSGTESNGDTNKPSKLPQTGTIPSAMTFVAISILALGSVGVMKNKKDR